MPVFTVIDGALRTIGSKLVVADEACCCEECDDPPECSAGEFGITNSSLYGWFKKPDGTIEIPLTNQGFANQFFFYEDSGRCEDPPPPPPDYYDDGPTGPVGGGGTGYDPCGGTNCATQGGSVFCWFEVAELSYWLVRVDGKVETARDYQDEASIFLFADCDGSVEVYDPDNDSWAPPEPGPLVSIDSRQSDSSSSSADPCEMVYKEDIKTVRLTPGRYTYSFECTTHDGLFHKDMVHTFLIAPAANPQTP